MRLIKVLIVIWTMLLLRLQLISSMSWLHHTSTLSLQLLLLMALANDWVWNLDFLKIVIVLSSSLRLIVNSSTSHHLRSLLMAKWFSSRAHNQWTLWANTSANLIASDLRLWACRFLHTRLEIVHMTLTLIDLFNGRYLLFSFWYIKIACRLLYNKILMILHINLEIHPLGVQGVLIFSFSSLPPCWRE